MVISIPVCSNEMQCLLLQTHSTIYVFSNMNWWWNSVFAPSNLASLNAKTLWNIITIINFTACAICGVLCISLPIPIIVNNFNKFYEKAKIEEEIEAKRKRTSWEDAKRGEIRKYIELSIIQGYFKGFILSIEYTQPGP